MKFYTGTIKDNKDPLERGRYKVFIHGFHSEGSVLPWSICKLPVTSSGSNGSLHKHTLEINSFVSGYFLDPDNQHFVIDGVFAGIDDYQYEPKMLPSGENEPKETQDKKYTELEYIKSKKGHIVEFNNADGNESVSVIHKDGHTISISNNSLKIKHSNDVYIAAKTITFECDNMDIFVRIGFAIKNSKYYFNLISGTFSSFFSNTSIKSDGKTSIKGDSVHLN